MLKRLGMRLHHPYLKVENTRLPFSQATQASSWHTKSTSPLSACEQKRLEIHQNWSRRLYHLESRWLATPISLGWFCWPLTYYVTFWEWRWHPPSALSPQEVRSPDLGSRSCWSKSRHVHARFATGCGPGESEMMIRFWKPCILVTETQDNRTTRESVCWAGIGYVIYIFFLSYLYFKTYFINIHMNYIDHM